MIATGLKLILLSQLTLSTQIRSPFKNKTSRYLKPAFHYVKCTVAQKHTVVKEKSDCYQTLQSCNYWFSNFQSNGVCG